MGDSPASTRPRSEWTGADWVWLAALVVAVGLCWAWIYGAFDPDLWSVPIAYGGDGLWTLAFAKLYSQGEFLPFLSKTASALNAPATAEWNDYPTTEEVVFTLNGLLARVFGLYTGTNLSLLLSHVLSGASFFWIARMLGARAALAFAGGIAFATCHFLWRHSAHHLVLTHCWHLPPLVAIALGILSGHPARAPGRKAGLAFAALSGAMNPYFSAMFVQLLALGAGFAALRRDFAGMRRPLELGLVVVLGFGIANADTFGSALRHGRNEGAVERSVPDLEQFALLPAALLRPRHHRIEALTSPALQSRGLRGAGAAYLGLLGIGGLLVLAGASARRLAAGGVGAVPAHTWLVLWVLAFSVPGGVNSLLGRAGFLLLRATDRYAVVVLVVALLFLMTWLSDHVPKRLALPVGLALAVLAVWDQVLPDPAVAVAQARGLRRVESDHELVERIETRLEKDAMVFQLPSVPFPEARAVHRMNGYEPLRPFLNSDALRFSYGAQKGGQWAQWQQETAGLPTTRMLERLEELGFAGILIHRDGFQDHGEGLLTELAGLGQSERIESRDGDFVFVRLDPAPDVGP